MWLEVTVRKNKNITLRAEDIASAFSLEYGIIGHRPVIIRKASGAYTRLYDPDRTGVCIEYHDDRDHSDIILNYPCGTEDIDLFFSIVSFICEKLDAYFFELREEMISRDMTDEYAESYKEEAKQTLIRIKEDFDRGRDAFLVYGSRMPVVLGPNEMKIIGTDLNEFERVYCEKQGINAAYLSPIVYSYTEEGRQYGAYELVGHKRFILPYDPEFLFNYEKKGRFDWVVNIGFANIRYDDFMSAVSKKNVFDEENIIVELSEDEKDELVRRFAWDPDRDMMTYRPHWGRWFLYGVSHEEKIKRKKLRVESVRAYNHLAVMLRWLAEHNRFSDAFKRWDPELIKEIYENLNDLRYIIRNSDVFRGRLRLAMFDYETAKILNVFCESEYLQLIDDYALGYFGKERYESAEFDDEAYLFVPFDEEYYDCIAKKIDERFGIDA